MFMEIWKDVVGFEGHYMVSNTGKLKSVKFNKERILKNLEVGPNGYVRIELTINGVVKRKYFHRVIAFAFIDVDPDRTYVNHKDGNKLNNHIDNLEWVNKRENSCHARILKGKGCESVGVHRYKNRFVSSITFDKKYRIIGRFKTAEEAHQARVNFEKENGIKNKYLFHKAKSTSKS